jgi:hypothetical protein
MKFQNNALSFIAGRTGSYSALWPTLDATLNTDVTPESAFSFRQDCLLPTPQNRCATYHSRYR